MIKPPLRSALDAAVCLYALDVFRRVGIACDVSKQDVTRRLDVARSYAYELVQKVEAAVDRGLDDAPSDEGVKAAQLRRLELRVAVLEYRTEHPGSWVSGGRTVYSSDLQAFVVELSSKSIGPEMTQADFASACGIPLPTLKEWWGDAARQLVLPLAPPDPQAPTDADDAPAPRSPEPPSPSDPPAPAIEPVAEGELGLSLEMHRVVAEYERWQGPFFAFVEHLRSLGLRYGKQMVSQILHLAAARKLLRRPPPTPSARGSTFRPPPGVQWTSDGKQVDVVVDGQTFRVNWQPTADIGSTATVGSVVRPQEDTAGVLDSFAQGVETTGAPSAAFLLDNKACNKNQAVADAVAPDTFVMHATPGRGQNKAVIEGSFGLFAQGLGPVVATIDTSTPENIALCVANAVTRAFAQGRNHHPRRRDGRTPYELYRDADPSPDEIAAAIERLRAIKERIDTREAREQARLDPAVLATIEQAIERFGFFDDGDVAFSLRTLPLAAIQSAVAIYAAKQEAGSLPIDAGIRYFAGIARNCQHERELLFFEQELVSQLERTGQIVRVHLDRKAAALASLDLASRLSAIVQELLTVTAPVAQVFWRRHFHAEADVTPVAFRHALRRHLCERVRRHYTASKRHRQALVDLIVRALSPPAETSIENCQP